MPLPIGATNVTFNTGTSSDIKVESQLGLHSIEMLGPHFECRLVDWVCCQEADPLKDRCYWVLVSVAEVCVLFWCVIRVF